MLLDFTTGLTANPIVGYHNRIFHQQHALQAAIRANDNAGLLAKPGKHAIKNSRENEQTDKPAHVCRRRLAYNVHHLINPNEVRHGRVRDENCDGHKNQLLARLLYNLGARPWGLVQPALLIRIAFNPVFDFAVDHFHENGLRASPPAPQPPEGHGEQNDKDEQRNERERQKKKILRPEHVPQDDKLAFEKIQQQQRTAAHLEERPAKEQGQKNHRHPNSADVKGPRRFFGIHPHPLAFGIYGGDGVAKLFIKLIEVVLSCVTHLIMACTFTLSLLAPPGSYKFPSGALALAGVVPCNVST